MHAPGRVISHSDAKRAESGIHLYAHPSETTRQDQRDIVGWTETRGRLRQPLPATGYLSSTSRASLMRVASQLVPP
jgi:hypothetical protein